MNVTPWSVEHLQSRRAVVAHFAGKASPATEAAMRAHLLRCAPCKHLYQRHLILARLDPQGLPAARRIAGGLGFRSRTIPVWSRWVGGIAVPVTVAVALIVSFGSHHENAVADAFTARGAAHGNVDGPSFWTYRIDAAGVPKLVEPASAVGARDELAFAYSNPTSKPYLMIFGVDEHRHVYWFHPAWPAGHAGPTAVRAAAGPGPHELPDAIRHAMDGRRLDVYAVFSEQTIDAAAVEHHLRASTDANFLSSLGRGIVTTRRTFEVLP